MNFESRNPEERAETYRRRWAAVEKNTMRH